MKKNNLIIYYLLALFALFPVGVTNAKVVYDSNTKTLTIYSIDGNDANEINQGKYNDAKIVILKQKLPLNGVQFDKLSGMETIMLSSETDLIPDGTFLNCKKLKSVNWNELTKLKKIGARAFSGCGQLCKDTPDFVMPNSVEVIEEQAFEECNSIKNLIFDADSKINNIKYRAFWMGESNPKGMLSDVFINVSPAREINCAKGAFDKMHTCGQTQVGVETTRLHYPSEFYDFYVGNYKANIVDNNVIGSDGKPIKGVITQSILNEAYNKATNGWQEFFSSGVVIGEQSLYRTYSNNVAYKVPNNSTLQVFLVYDYDKEQNVVRCIKMDEDDVIPANTGVIVHSIRQGTVYMELANSNNEQAYNAELYPNNKYKGQYGNYLKPINGSMHIDNVEIVNGKKTYRNYFFNNGKTASIAPGPDWNPEYINFGWGFFRAASDDYTVWNKAFLHLTAEMTNASSEYLQDEGTLPQDGHALGIAMYIDNYDDMVIVYVDEEPANILEYANDNKTDENWYTLQGMKVDKPARGIYINKGKKIIFK